MHTSLDGRFAPSPTGRMHLGNIYTAVISWLAAKSTGGRWVLRIEDLDPQRSRRQYARQIEDDLLWLGLQWDEGGLDSKGAAGPYSQSERGHIYTEYLHKLRRAGATYPCFCTRADIMATQAPHQSDGRIVYAGTCRPASLPCREFPARPHAERVLVPDSEITFSDTVFGPQSVNLAQQCGDFVLRRADGAWAYQLAVVVDDALMGIRQIVRGADLLLSSAQQIYLYRMLGFEPPSFAHLPLVCNAEGRRLSKRDASLGMAELRAANTPEQLLGRIAAIAGLIPAAEAISLAELLSEFSWSKISPRPCLLLPG